MDGRVPSCRDVGLTFHDLRRKAGSRLLEGGMRAHYGQRFLDHANLSTTSRYLKTTRRGTHEALTRVDGAETVAQPLHTRPILR